jgi:hypothetical protein
MCGFVGDVIGGVVDVIGSVVEVVIDNALPILETVALTAVLGPAGLGLSQLTATVVSRVAVTALNGGSLMDVATAGLTPMLPSIGQALGVNLDASGFISKSVGEFLGNGTLGNIVAGAIGEGTTAGLMAAVTGGDVLKAATMAGLSNVVATGLSKTWDTAREAIPALAEFQDSIKSGYEKLTGDPETLSTIKTMSDLESELTGQAQKYNDMLQKYQDTKHIYDIELDRFNEFKDANDISQANGMAKLINEGSGKTLNELGIQLNSLYEDYDTKNLEFTDFLKTNQATIEYAAPLIQELNNYQSQYDLFDNKLKADYANYAMTESVFKGDFVKASDYLKEYNTANATIAKLDPTAMVGHDLGNEQLAMLDKIASTTDEATRQQLISQAKLDPVFAEIMNSPLPDYTKIEPVKPSTPSTGTGTGTSTNPYDNLPTLPEGGIGQPTPPTPTTPTTPPTGTGTGSTISNIGADVEQYLTNVVPKALGNITKGVIGNEVINAILGNDPQRPSLPTKPRPPSKVDVSTLRPFSGNLPSNVTANVTPEKKDPTTLTPFTGGLPTTGGATTPTTNTTTQTPTGGLQSNQTQTPPTKVDVSRLTPVTDTNWLKSLGIA